MCADVAKNDYLTLLNHCVEGWARGQEVKRAREEDLKMRRCEDEQMM